MKTRIKISVAGLSWLTAIALFSGVAHATHHSWVLKEAGSSCVTAVSNKDVSRYGGITNMTTADIGVLCPVNLAGTFQSDGAVSFTMQTSIPSRQSELYVNDTQAVKNISCQAVARTGGGVYFGGIKYSAGTGKQTITLVDNAGYWGSQLAYGDIGWVYSLAYWCTVPPQSNIIGTVTNICQRDTAANDPRSCYDL